MSTTGCFIFFSLCVGGLGLFAALGCRVVLVVLFAYDVETFLSGETQRVARVLREFVVLALIEEVGTVASVPYFEFRFFLKLLEVFLVFFEQFLLDE